MGEEGSSAHQAMDEGQLSLSENCHADPLDWHQGVKKREDYPRKTFVTPAG